MSLTLYSGPAGRDIGLLAYMKASPHRLVVSTDVRCLTPRSRRFALIFQRKEVTDNAFSERQNNLYKLGETLKTEFKLYYLSVLWW